MGHSQDLEGEWSAATPEYQKVCAKRVRAGCEHLAKTLMETGEEGERTELLSPCDQALIPLPATC